MNFTFSVQDPGEKQAGWCSVVYPRFLRLSGQTLSKMESHMIPLNAPLEDDRAAGTIVVTMPAHPPDFIVWSVASLFYGNPCCLGMLAFYFSVKVSGK